MQTQYFFTVGVIISLQVLLREMCLGTYLLDWPILPNFSIVLLQWGWCWSKLQASKHPCRNILVMAQMLCFLSSLCSWANDSPSSLINAPPAAHRALTSPHPLLFYAWCLLHSWPSLQGPVDFCTFCRLWPSLTGKPDSEAQEVISGVTSSGWLAPTDPTAWRNASARGTDSWFDQAAALSSCICCESHCW